MLREPGHVEATDIRCGLVHAPFAVYFMYIAEIEL